MNCLVAKGTHGEGGCVVVEVGGWLWKWIAFGSNIGEFTNVVAPLS